MSITLKFKKLSENATTPTRSYGYGNCWDVYAAETKEIHSFESTIVPTDLAFEVPQGYQLHVYNRSSNPLKNKLILSNSCGIVDTNYRGNLGCLFHTLPKMDENPNNRYWNPLFDNPVIVKKADKIAQIKLVPIQNEDIEEVAELSETERGEGGFGSSNNK